MEYKIDVPPSPIIDPEKTENEPPVHILVVDDEPEAANTLSELLEAVGYVTFTAHSARQALETLRQETVSIALLDINLPDIDGTELLHTIRQEAPYVSCIMTTGDNSVGSAIDALNTGAAYYLTKPIDEMTLITKIQDIAEKQRLIRDNQALMKQQRDTIRHLRRLQSLSLAISSSLELDQVLQAVRNSVIEALGYDRCGIYLLDYERRVIQGRWGTQPNGEIRDISFKVFPMDGDAPISRVARKEIQYYRTVNWEEEVGSGKALAAVDMEGIGAHAILPLVTKDRVEGILTVDNRLNGRIITEEDIQELLPFAAQAATAVYNASFYRQIRDTAQIAAERAAELQRLWKVSQTINAELDLETVLQRVTDSVGDAMGAPYFSLLLWNRRRHELEVRAAKGGEALGPLHRLFAQGCSITDEIHSTGQPVIVGDFQTHPDRAIGELAEAAGVRSILAAPLLIGEAAGMIAVYSPNPDLFTSGDVRLLSTLASLVAAAIRNAQSYDRERNIAETLQVELLSPRPEQIGDFYIDKWYQSALEEAQVGGDFYDVIELPDGRLALLMADVSGKGLKAAVYTAMGKYMFRGLLMDDPSPGHLLQRLNAAICRYTEAGMFITLFYGLLDPRTGLLRYANAGHESPIHYMAATQTTAFLDSTGVVLGVEPKTDYPEQQLEVNRGDIILFYTDGLTDARNGEDLLGLEGLQQIFLETLDEKPASLVESLYNKARDYASGFLHDDIAMLTLEARNFSTDSD